MSESKEDLDFALKTPQNQQPTITFPPSTPRQLLIEPTPPPPDVVRTSEEIIHTNVVTPHPPRLAILFPTHTNSEPSLFSPQSNINVMNSSGDAGRNNGIETSNADTNNVPPTLSTIRATHCVPPPRTSATTTTTPMTTQHRIIVNTNSDITSSGYDKTPLLNSNIQQGDLHTDTYSLFSPNNNAGVNSAVIEDDNPIPTSLPFAFTTSSITGVDPTDFISSQRRNSNLSCDAQQLEEMAAANSAAESDRNALLSQDKKRGLRRMFKRLWPEKGKISIGLIALMIGSLCSLSIPLMVGKLIDLVAKPDTHLGDIKWLIIGTLVILTISAISTFAQMGFLFIAGEKVVSQLRVDLFRSLIYREISFFDVTNTGDLLSRLNNDVSALNSALTVALAELCQRLAIILGALAYMLYLSWDLTLIALFIAPIIGVSGSKLAHRFHAMAKEVNHALSNASITASETLSNIRTTRTMSLEWTKQQEYNRQIAIQYSLNRKQKLMKAFQRTYVALLGGLAVVGVLVYGSWKVLQGYLTSGDLMTFVLFGLNIGINIGGVMDNWTALSVAAGACEKVLDLIRQAHGNDKLYYEFKGLTPYHRGVNDTDFDKYIDQLAVKDGGLYSDPSLQKKNKKNGRTSSAPYDSVLLQANPQQVPVLTPLDLRRDIVFSDVYFAYPSRPSSIVLRGLTLTIRSGQSVGFVGNSGGGKSSTVSLLERMYDPIKGEITIGGENINSMNEVLYRTRIGYVQQASQMYNSSVADNILSGVSNFKLHDCAHTIHKIKQVIKERKDGVNPYDEQYYDPAYFDAYLGYNTGPPICRNNICDTNSNAQRDPIHDDINNTNDNSHSTILKTIDPDNIICPCKFRDDIPLCQDLYGKQYTLSDVKTAAIDSNAHDFIMNLPDGYHTIVNEKLVSGGQAQRLSIARQYLVDSDLVLLDEATSALDLEGERSILESLSRLTKNKTSITVAHRLTTIVHCDVIFFFSHGRVVEHGTHQELLKKKGYYEKLWKMQFDEKEGESPQITVTGL